MNWRELEGWQVFDTQWGPEIEKIDDPGPDDGSVLESDLHAVIVVLDGALKGREYADSALREVGFDISVFPRAGYLEPYGEWLQAISNAKRVAERVIADHFNESPDMDLLRASKLFVAHD